MNKKELCNVVSEKIGMTKKDTLEIIDAVFESITEELADGGDVSLSGFGKFISVEKEERECRNPKTGETVIVPAHNAVKFKASATLKDTVR